MALQANEVDVAQLQHVGIRTTVDQVAGLAAVGLHGLMFEDERALLVGMALEADCVLGGGSADLFGPFGAVHVVAIAALHEAFIHAMMEGHFKLSFLLEMAGVAELGL